jgi:hypothetical protein
MSSDDGIWLIQVSSSNNILQHSNTLDSCRYDYNFYYKHDAIINKLELDRPFNELRLLYADNYSDFILFVNVHKMINNIWENIIYDWENKNK